jgi:hypothetical protein
MTCAIYTRLATLSVTRVDIIYGCEYITNNTHTTEA